MGTTTTTDGLSIEVVPADKLRAGDVFLWVGSLYRARAVKPLPPTDMSRARCEADVEYVNDAGEWREFGNTVVRGNVLRVSATPRSAP